MSHPGLHAVLQTWRRRLRSRTGQVTLLVVVLVLGWVCYLVVGIATDESIRSAYSVRELAVMVQRNLDADDGKSLQTHFTSGTVSADYGTTFVDKLDEQGFTDVRVRPGAGFVEVSARGAGRSVCTAWDVERSGGGSVLLDPTPSTSAGACH